MTCDATQPKLPLYVGGDLPPREAGEVRAHVAACGRCAEALEGFRATQLWLRSARAPEIGAEAFDRLRSSVRRRIAEAPPRPWLIAWASRWLEAMRGSWLQPAAVAAAGVALVVGLGSWGVLRPRLLEPPGPAAEIALARPAPKAAEAPAAATGSGAAAGVTAAGGASDPTAGELLARADGLGGAEDADLEPSSAGRLRIELRTQDPTVRIIWFGNRIEDGSSGAPGAAQN